MQTTNQLENTSSVTEVNAWFSADWNISRLRRHLTRYAVMYLPLHVINDIVQETYVHAVEHADGFRHHCELKTWIYQIARNLTLDTIDYFRHGHEIPFSQLPKQYLRTKYQHDENYPYGLKLNGHRIESVRDPAASAEEYLETKIVTLHLLNRINLLTPRQMQFAWHILLSDGSTYEQIAKRFGVATGTVKATVHAIRERVKPTLEGMLRTA